jgi:hypothetical protein
VGGNVTCKVKKTQVVVFILFSPSQICFRSSFFPLVFCSFLLQAVYLAPEEGGLEAGGGQIWDMWAPLCRAATGGSDSVWASWSISGEGDWLLLWWGLFGGDL